MSDTPLRVILLGSQREEPDVGRAVQGRTGGGRVALVTAGWQEWEEDDARLRKLLGPGSFNLDLYRRAERVWGADPELAAAHRAVQNQVRALRRAYNVRLASAMEAWIQMEHMAGDEEVLARERADALAVVRALDRRHLVRLSELRKAFDHRWRPQAREAVAREREELARLLEGVTVVVVEGGHVPVLLNRLRLFGLRDLLGGRTVVGCSGGAMTLGERVVLFHDTPPWGPGHAEAGEVGLGLAPGVIALPLAARRLRLDDPGRVSRMARRFAPDVCVPLERGTGVAWDGRWHAMGSRRLGEGGRPEPWPETRSGAA